VKASEDDSRLCLGRHTLRFVSTPYVCTPGHQVIFDERDGVLFSGDPFAQVGPPEWSLFAEGDLAQGLRMAQEKKCGVTHYPAQAIEKLRSLPIKIVASGHRQLIRHDLDRCTEVLSA
jgi:flavorubredoxin